ncbi:glycosyltransferase family 4 protein [Lysinibacillus sp. 3P01SB]|uniref:glycosyltransferase family 4 protein n=1 Tax=Lysinibacillus sp. 3P01SB TaxID=3132284 RepID=UPI0039A63646
MRKIAFIGHDLKFINHIIDYFDAHSEYEVKKDEWQGHEAHSEARSLEIVEWADILFCEWGLGNVIWYQERKKEHQKLIVRLHRFEMDTKYVKMFDYTKIDMCIAISPYIFEEFYRVAKVPREKMKVIFNAVDTERFNKPKKAKAGFHLGIIGYVPKLKRLDRAIDIFEKLYAKDPRYKLFIKGKHPKDFGWVWDNTEQREYYEAIFKRIDKSNYKKNVVFEGWGDVAEWLQNIGYVLSVSDYESFHMAPIEGMASGALPVVLRREGVNTIFPQQFIVETHDEAVESILQTQLADVDMLKDFVSSNYGLEVVCREIEEVLNDQNPNKTAGEIHESIT